MPHPSGSKQASTMSELQRIVNHLILNTPAINDIGLFNGKMGVSIFFFHYARFTGEEIYASFAGLLLEQVGENINTYTPINMQDGLCGIGWGMEYLNQQQFICIDTDEILAELDAQIMTKDIRRMTDRSLATGLEGIIHYWISRCRNCTGDDFPFDTCYKEDLKRVLIENQSCLTTLFPADVYMEYLFQNKRQDILSFSLLSLTNASLSLTEDIRNYPLGLQNGLAGIGFRHINNL